MAPSGAHVTVGGSGSHGTAQAGPATAEPLCWALGFGARWAPSSTWSNPGRPAVLRAGLKSGHRGWKKLADISTRSGGLRPSKRMFLVCRGGPPDKAWFPWQSAFTPGLQGQALASAGMGTAGGREPITAWKVSAVRPSQGWRVPGTGTRHAQRPPPRWGHLRAEAQPPGPASLSLLVSGLFS